MKYFGAPRWRYLLVPFWVIPGVFIAVLLTGATLGCFRAMGAWADALEWLTYDR